MKIKTYRAASIAEALASIKKELGPEAFILGQKEIPAKRRLGVFGKTTFEVTAGVDFAQGVTPIARTADTGGSPDLVSLTYTASAGSVEPKAGAAIPERNILLEEIRELRSLVEASASGPPSRSIVIQTARRFSSASSREAFANLLKCGFNAEFAGDC